MNERRSAIAQYEATVVLIVISLSLASIVYAGLKRESNLGSESIFVNERTMIGGSPAIELLRANSSSQTALSSLSMDDATSADGVLAFSGSSYSTTTSFCGGGSTTFFSVFASQAGLVQIITDGRPWISGSSASSLIVAPGWHEVMIVHGTSCSISLPGGSVVSGLWSPASTLVSSIPIEGGLSGTSFTLYLPTDGDPHRFLLTSAGGLDTGAL
jgi:hypothetical protein